MKRLLVTGAAGFIAFHTIDRLLKEGYEIVGIDNFDPFYDRKIKEKNINDLMSVSKEVGKEFSFIEGDINSIQNFSSEIGTVSGIIHLGAKAGVRPSIENPSSYLKANISGTLNLLEYAIINSIKKFIFGSSSSVYGNSTPSPYNELAIADKPVSPYAASKRSCELYCYNFSEMYKLNIAVLRFFTVYGERQRPDLAIHKFTNKIFKGEKVTLFGDGESSRDYTYVSDIVDGIVRSWNWLEDKSGGTYEVFNLGGSNPISLKNLFSQIEKNCCKQSDVEWKPMQLGDVAHTFADLEKSRKILGYNPKISIEEGLDKFVSWYKNEHKLI